MERAKRDIEANYNWVRQEDELVNRKEARTIRHRVTVAAYDVISH